MVAGPECQVCGHRGASVRPGVVHWRYAPGRTAEWEAVPRCPDRAECAQRVRDAGGTWPLIETDRSILAILGEAAPDVIPEPAQSALTAATIAPADDPRGWW